MVSQLIVHPQTDPLRGSIPLPSDQDLALARLVLGLVGRGTTSVTVRGLQRSLQGFLRFCDSLGVESSFEDDVVRVKGAGLGGLRAPTQILDLRGDADLGALALGLLVSGRQRAQLLVDDVVAELLVPALSEAHAIHASGEADGGVLLDLPPLAEGVRPEGSRVVTTGIFPWVKQAILLAGLRASSPTVLEERFASADHLERAMTRARIPIDAAGTSLVLHPPRDEDALAPQTYESLGSAQLSAAVAVAVATVPGSQLTLRDVSTNPTRSDLLGALKLFGCRVGLTPNGDRQGEPFGDLFVEAGPLVGSGWGGESAMRLGDGALSLFALGARARGKTTLADLVPRARGANPGIFPKALGLLRSAGIEANLEGAACVISGRPDAPLDPLRVTSGGDSRLVLLATLLALHGARPSVIDDVDCLTLDFPRWVGSLRALGAKIDVRQSE